MPSTESSTVATMSQKKKQKELKNKNFNSRDSFDASNNNNSTRQRRGGNDNSEGGKLNNSAGGNPQAPYSGTPSKRSPKRKTSSINDSFKENEAAAGNVSSPSPHSPAWMPEWLKFFDQYRRKMGIFINGDRVQYFILALIMINAIMMGVATFPIVKENEATKAIFNQIDRVFLIIFTIESGLQLIYHGWTLFKDGFLVFDMLIVILSWALDGTQVIRAFRIFRALRLVTRVEVMRHLVSAMFAVMPKLGAIFALMSLVFYIFGVMFTQLYKNLSKECYDPESAECYDPDGYFSSLPRTLFTLFQIMCLVSRYFLPDFLCGPISSSVCSLLIIIRTNGQMYIVLHIKNIGGHGFPLFPSLSYLRL